MILTLPVTILTLGLFLLVVNGLMLGLTAFLVPGFQIAGFWAAFFGALIVSAVSCVGSWISDRWRTSPPAMTGGSSQAAAVTIVGLPCSSSVCSRTGRRPGARTAGPSPRAESRPCRRSRTVRQFQAAVLVDTGDKDRGAPKL